jgi:hypothetical protein
MTKVLVVICLSLLGVSVLDASNTAPSSPYQAATITSVAKLAVTEPSYGGGDNPSDAPLQSRYFAYNVGVKTTCGRYVAHYEAPYDFLPFAFASGHELPVLLGKHTMTFDLGYRTMQMNMIRYQRDRNANCSGVRK